jgi:hypothetical protein
MDAKTFSLAAGLIFALVALLHLVRIFEEWPVDPPPLKWSDLRYVLAIKEDCNGKEAIQA